MDGTRLPAAASAADETGMTELDVLAPAPDLASATHRGPAHEIDEDAVQVGSRERDGLPLHALVVCDGVSASSHGEQAAARAAQAALDVLLAAAGRSGPLHREAALREAVAAAHRAACAPGIQPAPGKDPPGTTLVAAIAHGGRVAVAWVGDSRAYLVGPAPAHGGSVPAALLTHDHSWLNEMVESGRLTAAEAAQSPTAHALTRCLGPLENADPERPPKPGLVSVRAVAGSLLVLCSDGLWNGAAGPTQLGRLVAGLPPSADASSLAVDLVRRALALGGQDDITAAVARL